MPKSIYKTIRLTPELAEWIQKEADKDVTNFSHQTFKLLSMIKEAFDNAEDKPRKVIVSYFNVNDVRQ